MRRFALAVSAALFSAVSLLPVPALAGYAFKSIDGGTIDLDGYKGKPVLVVNTASLCMFAHQFEDLQALQDEFGPKGLVVLAVPSDDFNQELDSSKAVKDYCDANFNISMPMTEITHVIGPDAHPFYAMMRDEHGFEPGWNFNKVLLDGEGQVVETWGSLTNPRSGEVVRKIEALLP